MYQSAVYGWACIIDITDGTIRSGDHVTSNCSLSNLDHLDMFFFTHLCIVRNNPSNIFHIPQQLCGMPLAILWWWMEWRDIPDNKVHGSNMGPTGGWQDPGGPHVGPMNYTIWDSPLVFIILIKNCWWNRLPANHPLGGLHIKQCLKDYIGHCNGLL